MISAAADTAPRPGPLGRDDVAGEADDVCYRAIDVDAPPDVVFRWLCRRQLNPSMERPATGQRVMRVFELRDFDPGRQLTAQLDWAPAWCGQVTVTYMVLATEGGGSRIAVKLAVRHDGVATAVRRLVPLMGTTLLLGDLLMMRTSSQGDSGRARLRGTAR